MRFFDNTKYVSLNKQPCQCESTLITIDSDEPLHYPFVVSVNQRSVSCNTADHWYVWICVPDKAKHMNVKVFNLMSRLNKTSFLVQNECRLNKNVYNSE